MFTGADRGTLLLIYQAMIRPAIDYGCLGYTTTGPSVLGRLDVVQYRALRPCSGAFRTASVQLGGDGGGPSEIVSQVCWLAVLSG